MLIVVCEDNECEIYINYGHIMLSSRLIGLLLISVVKYLSVLDFVSILMHVFNFV